MRLTGGGSIYGGKKRDTIYGSRKDGQVDIFGEERLDTIFFGDDDIVHNGNFDILYKM